MAVDDGRRFGNRRTRAFDQSTCSVESWFAQNSRSSSSVLKTGIFFKACLGFLIPDALPPIHVTCRDNPNQDTTHGEHQEQFAICEGPSECIPTLFRSRMLLVEHYQQGFTEKGLLAFARHHIVAGPHLGHIPLVPFETGAARQHRVHVRHIGTHSCLVYMGYIPTVNGRRSAVGWTNDASLESRGSGRPERPRIPASPRDRDRAPGPGARGLRPR